MSAAKKTNVIRMQEAEDHHLHDDEDLFRPHKKGEEGEGPWLVSYADLMTLLMGFFALMFSMSTPDSKKMEKIRQAAVSSFGGKMEQPYLGLTNDLKEFIKENNLDDKVLIKTTIDGVEMTFVGTLFFDSGDFRVKQDAAQLMEQLAGVIKRSRTISVLLLKGIPTVLRFVIRSFRATGNCRGYELHVLHRFSKRTGSKRKCSRLSVGVKINPSSKNKMSRALAMLRTWQRTVVL